MQKLLTGLWASFFLGAYSPSVWAHSFGAKYSLPLPVSLYIAALAAVLLISLVVCGLLIRAKPKTVQATGQGLEVRSFRFSRPVRVAMQSAGFAAFALCIWTATWGSNNPYGNISMSLFWVVFVLGYAYLCAIVGNSFQLISPWRTLVSMLQAMPGCSRLFVGRWAWPAALGMWPAVALYIGFIAVELFGDSRPNPLGHWLCAYTALNLVMCWAFGAKAWFKKGEFFNILFDLLGKGAALRWSQRGLYRVPWGSGWTKRAPAQPGLTVFLLFMLSSTAFDGLHETAVWVDGFWFGLYPIMQPFIGDNVLANHALLREAFQWYQLAGLLISPFLYLLVFWFFLAWMRALGGDPRPLSDLARLLLYSLLPIAVAYHFSHYFSLLLDQGQQMYRLASDPPDWGWNLFGTANWYSSKPIMAIENVWNVQVLMIALGHIAASVVAHKVTLDLYDDQRTAMWVQLPLLLLMILYTSSGLWVLAQPLSRGTAF